MNETKEVDTAPMEQPVAVFEGRRCLVSLRGWAEVPGREQVRSVWGTLLYVSDPLLLVDIRPEALKAVQKRTPGFLIGAETPVFIPMAAIDGISLHDVSTDDVNLSSTTFNAEG